MFNLFDPFSERDHSNRTREDPMFRLRSILPLFLLTVSAAWLGGCDSSTGPSGPAGPAGTGTELSAGSYFIQYDSDDLYKYEQYFVVQPGYHWEFVEYGYKADTKTLCQVTRKRGNYSSTDSTLTMAMLTWGESVEKCGMTQADFNAYPFEAVPVSDTGTYHIRHMTATSFDGKDFFDGTSPGWQTYSKKPDPYGFF